MEANNDQLQVQSKLEELLTRTIQLSETGEMSISVYTDKLTPELLKSEMSRLKIYFPKTKPDFFIGLVDRLRANNFTDARLKAAVDHLIDNYTYPEIMAANVISYDSRVKLYTYEQICDLVSQYGASVWENYKAIKMPGLQKKVFVSVIDIQKYNLETI
jgi:hypothetical protein